MKRKSNIKYDPNKSRSSVKMDFGNQANDTENMKLNTSLEEEVVDKLVESIEKLEKVEEIVEQNFSDIEIEIKNDTIEKKVEMFNDLPDDNVTSMESTTWEDVSDISDVKPDEKTMIEEENFIKGKSKNGVNLRQETQGVKETVKKMIQEKKLEAKQRREVNDERKNIELSIKPMKKKGVTAEMVKGIEILKQELKESTDRTPTDKTPTMGEEPKIVKERMKDDEFSKQKPVVTQKKGKIKLIKSGNLEQTENTVEEENTIVNIKVDAKKIAKSQDKIDVELSETEVVQEEDKEENAKTPKSINVRESIRNIINQFKEFEKDFIRDDIDTMTSTNDTKHIESDSHIAEEIDYSVESNGQLMVKDARESLKEIIDQFKYIKHELTSEEDDQFDEIAAKYMERPIAETLLQFSEALKILIQRRKKTSPKEHGKESSQKNSKSRE